MLLAGYTTKVRSGGAALARGGAEVGGLVDDPAQITGDILARAELVHRRVTGGEVAVGDEGVDGAVADRMDRHGLRTALALGDDVMALDTVAERAAAQGAGRYASKTRVRASALSAWVLIRSMPSTTKREMALVAMASRSAMVSAAMG